MSFKLILFINLILIIRISSKKLQMDEAYLKINNFNSNSSLLLMNSIICEQCDLEETARIDSNSNVTLIISSQYAYDLQIVFNQSLYCSLKSYKFHEYAIYLIEINENRENLNEDCLVIEQGERSAYWSPIIVAFLILIIIFLLIELIIYYLNKKEKKLSEETIPLLDRSSTVTINHSKLKSKRFQSLDAIRGLALMIMIFVDYGGGGYWFFNHAIWNGLNLADIPFPWFVWLIGFSIVLSQKSLRSKNIRKRKIFLKISRRTLILFLLGLTDDGGLIPLENLEILGVLQRLALCYWFTAIIVLFIGKNNSKQISSQNEKQNWFNDLRKSVLNYWLQWLCIILITIIWLLITFLVNVNGCPKGYLGPGGKHQHGIYQNCTGGAARYIDQLILTDAHMGVCWTCKHIYNTSISFEPEGSLGVLTGIILCYLGVQGAHIYIHIKTIRRRCICWFILGSICGTIGLILSNGSIPINKNLWSLSFILIDGSLAFIILILFYLIIDIGQYLTFAPFIWLGINSISIYMLHKLFRDRFPVQFHVEKSHAKQMALQIYGVLFWIFISAIMFFKKVFITV